MSVLVWIEQSGGEAVSSSLEVMGKGREIADALGTTLTALVAGAETAATAAATQQYGADAVLTATSPVLEQYRLGAYADVLKAAIDEADASVVLTSATIRGRELSAAAACDLEAGLAPDAIDLRVEDGSLVAVRTAYSGNIITDVTFNTAKQVASVRPRAFPLPEAGAATGEVKELAVSLNEEAIAEKVTKVATSDSGEVSLTDANLIVSGGRGVAQDPEKGFALVCRPRWGIRRSSWRQSCRSRRRLYPIQASSRADWQDCQPRSLHCLRYQRRYSASSWHGHQQGHCGHQQRPRCPHLRACKLWH